ncbi:unnamed protein product [Meganyctiphanes norvegica]|uniref:Transmembrane protein 199 n=1 Tax=Meganyctiphanes norvegica TaxID=48144 RepID=A0AAV2PMS2_MEGNR
MDHITIIPSRSFICVLQELKNVMGAPEIIKEAQFSDDESKQIHLTTQDIKWCHMKMRERGMKERIHEMIAESCINLPKYEPPPRSPELEARVQQLRKDQENKEYREMTKTLCGEPSSAGIADVRKDLRSLNRQLVTGAQYILSIVGTFFAIFIGSGLAIPDYGTRVLLAVIVALVVALAELYFLIRDDLREEEQLDKNK